MQAHGENEGLETLDLELYLKSDCSSRIWRSSYKVSRSSLSTTLKVRDGNVSIQYNTAAMVIGRHPSVP